MIIGKQIFKRYGFDNLDTDFIEFLDSISITDIEDDPNLQEMLFLFSEYLNDEEKEYFEHKTSIVQSNNVYHAYKVLRSSFIWNSYYITNSHTIKDSNDIIDSNFIISSSDINSSNDIIRSWDIKNCKHIIDCHQLDNCMNMYKSYFSRNCYFSQDLNNCDYCLFCTNLTGARFMIFNKEVEPRKFFIISSFVKQTIDEENIQFVKAPTIFEYSQKQNIIWDFPYLPYHMYNEYSKKFYDFMKTCPNYNEMIMYALTYSDKALKFEKNRKN